ncbi:MAG: hypothetical protein IJY20_07465 [Clostridia bacterium]|nr:hypothetical protein [Clostridia bacterium]
MKTKEWLARRPQHLVARVVCLLLAVITWLCVMRVSPPICGATLNNVSLRVVDADGVAYTGELDSDVMAKVRIQGTKETLAAVTASDVSAYVNMIDLIAEDELALDGIYTMTVYFKTPEGITIDGSYNVNVRLKEKA